MQTVTMPGFCTPFAAGVRAERWEEDGIGTRLYRRSRLFNEAVVSKIDILFWFAPIANREGEPERASFSKFTLNTDLSFVRFHSKPAKGQSKAGGMSMFYPAFRLSKLFKDVFVLILRDTLAVITHRDRHIRCVALDFYTNCPI